MFDLKNKETINLLPRRAGFDRFGIDIASCGGSLRFFCFSFATVGGLDANEKNVVRVV